MKGERVFDKMKLPYPCYVNYGVDPDMVIEWCDENIECKWGYFHQNNGTLYIYITDDVYGIAYKLKWS